MGCKIYEYNGKHYCEKNLSKTDDKYGGNLFDLYWQATQHDGLDDVLCEVTTYYSAYDPDTLYETAEELIESYFEDSIIGEVEND